MIASALIIAVCGAAIHTIVNLRRREAKDAGVPYMDAGRKAVLMFAAVAGGGYAAAVVIAVVGGW